MIIHIEATGELVSSPSERETRETKERTAIVLQSNVGDPSLDDRHVVTRDKGQLSNRNSRDPSYLGNSSKNNNHLRIATELCKGAGNFSGLKLAN